MKVFKIVFISVLLFALHVNAQTKTNIEKTLYLPIKTWKKLNNRPLTAKDSLNFIYKDNDTLVKAERYKQPEGVLVPYEYKDSTFLSYYTKVAFRTKNDSTDLNQNMKYWKKPIKVFFGKSISENAKTEFKNFAISTVQKIDSLQIKFVDNVEDSNYIVYYKDDYDYESKINKKDKSNYYMHWNGANQITKFAMRINNDYYFSDKLRLIEMKRYFIESVGYFKTIKDFKCESYFSSCNSKEKELTDLDIELLKYHYSYGICKGTNLKTFLEQHKQAKELFKINPKNKMNFLHKN